MDPGLLSLIGILIALIILMVLAYKGFPVLILAPVCAAIIAIFSKVPVYDGLQEFFMAGFSGFAKNYFLLLLMSAVFGKFMDASGAANIIALWILKLTNLFPKRMEKTMAVFCMAMINAALTYGGISLFVVTFTTVSISKTMYEKLNIPWSITMAASLGSATFTMTMLPGSPQLTNIVPTTYLGTTPMAGATLGIISSIIMVALGITYIAYAIKKYEKTGEGFLPSGAEISKVIPSIDLTTQTSIVDLIKAVLPCIILLIAMNAFDVAPAMSLVLGTVICALIFLPTLKNKDIKETFKAACQNGLTAVANTAAIYGFGSMVSNVVGFTFVVNGLSNLPGPPIVQMIVAVEIAAGITGSSSGGVGIALGALGQRFLDMGIAPAAIHRIGAIAAGGLDSLPHTTGLQTSLAASRLQMKGSYIHMFVMSVILPIIVCIIAAVLYTAFGIL